MMLIRTYFVFVDYITARNAELFARFPYWLAVGIAFGAVTV